MPFVVSLPQQCLRSAVQAGFSAIQVLNHIDNPEHNAWRNYLDFDPLVRYQGWTYEDLIIRPAADAIRTVTKPNTRVSATYL
jgi:hypothetical protein